MSSNVENLYDNEIRVIEDLVNRVPELSAAKNALLAKAEYKRGKRYLRRDRPTAARRAFKKAIEAGVEENRVYPLLLLTYLPLRTSTSFEALERATMAVRRVID